MSSTIIDAPDLDATPTPTAGLESNTVTRTKRPWLVVASALVAATLGLTLVWQTSAGATASSGPVVDASSDSAAVQVPASTVGAGLLAMAWELTPPAQQAEACAQFSADPAAAWSAYSSPAQTVATRPEFAAFFRTSC